MRCPLRSELAAPISAAGGGVKPGCSRSDVTGACRESTSARAARPGTSIATTTIRTSPTWAAARDRSIACGEPAWASRASPRSRRQFEVPLMSDVLPTGSHRERQLFQPAQEPARPPPQLLCAQFDAGEAAQQRGNRDLGLEPGQRRSQAEVDALPESNMAVVAAGDVELVRVREHRGIPVGRTEHRQDDVVAA